MLKLAVTLALLGLAFAIPTSKINDTPRAFDMWKQQHAKNYTGVEHDKRYRIWQANARIVEQHNSEGHSWTMGMTQFADLTPKEFEAMQTLFIKGADAPERHVSSGDLPASIDWRHEGVVNEVKNQGSCGSCWAFSTIVSYEGQVAKKTGKLVSYSEQDLVDCVKDQTLPGDSQSCCMGCNGGLMDYAFAYMIAKQDGLDDTESAYPYKGSDGTCSFSKSDAGSTPVTGYVDIEKGNEDDLKDAVANVGPISVAVDANMFWQLYSGGVFKPLWCNKDSLNHGVAAVGYGSEDGKNYWIIRNSWGSSWGESGYMRLYMGNNECGVANSATYPKV